jgi:hypothetical protein
MDEEPRQHELTQADSLVIRRLATNMRVASILMLVYGAGFGLMGILSITAEGTEGWASLLQGTLFLLIGLWTLQAGSSFARVVATQAPDLGQLRPAPAKLLSIYRLQKWLMVLGIVLFVAVCYGTFFLIFAMPKLQRYFGK